MTTTHRLRWRRTTATLLAALATVVPLTGCNKDNAADPNTTPVGTEAASTTAPATTTTSTASSVTTAPLRPDMSPDEIAVRNVLDQYAAESAAAYDPPDPNRPGLLALVTGALKQVVTEGLTQSAAKGLYYRREGGGPSPHRTESVEFPTPDTAVAIECHIGDKLTYRSGTNELVDPAISSYRFRTSLVRTNSGWALSLRDKLEEVNGTKLCRNLV